MFENVKILGQDLMGECAEVNANGRPGFVLFSPLFNITSPHNWLWYAPTFADRLPNRLHAWMFRQFLANGMVIAGIDVGESYGNPESRDTFTVFHAKLTKDYNLSKKACLMPQSRGGLMLYNWAVEHPEKVACIAGIYPVCDMKSYPGIDVAAPAYSLEVAELEAHINEHNPVNRLVSLAKAIVPIFHVHGDSDTLVPLECNSSDLAGRYQYLDGSMELLIVPGKGHDESDEYFKCQRLVDFVLKHKGM